jgi:hypothetical protein
MHTPDMMMSIQKSLPCNSGENSEHLAQQRMPLVHKLLPHIELALASGWTRKELWESLVHDGLDVNYKTRPYCHHRLRPKVASHIRARTAGKALMGIPTKKRFSLFALSMFPSK